MKDKSDFSLLVKIFTTKPLVKLADIICYRMEVECKLQDEEVAELFDLSHSLHAIIEGMRFSSTQEQLSDMTERYNEISKQHGIFIERLFLKYGGKYLTRNIGRISPPAISYYNNMIIIPIREDMSWGPIEQQLASINRGLIILMLFVVGLFVLLIR